MNRVTRGTVVLAAALAAMSCKGDPTSDLRNGADHLLATPSAIFLPVDSTASVVVEVVDAQGNALASTFSATVTGAITADRDLTWNAVYDNNGNLVLPSQVTTARFNITPLGSASNASVRVTASGKNIDIPVRVLPTSIPAVYSSATPNPGDTVTITVGAPFKVLPSVIVTTGSDTATIVSVAADSSAVSFVPVPRAGAADVGMSNVILDFLPSAKLTLPADPGMTLTAYAGTDAHATAPTIAIPAAGASSYILDVGDFAGSADCTGFEGVPCRYYKFTLAAATTFHVSLSWNNTTDLGVYFEDAAGGGVGTGACDAHGNGATGQPEACDQTLPAGDYFLSVVTFSPFYASPDDVDPTKIEMTITGQ
jgi:hypothetical protein